MATLSEIRDLGQAVTFCFSFPSSPMEKYDYPEGPQENVLNIFNSYALHMTRTLSFSSGPVYLLRSLGHVR